MSMFCYQCEETTKGSGCEVSGVCGKSPEVAALQDLLVYALTGIAAYAAQPVMKTLRDAEVDDFIFSAFFTTVTNVNFDSESLQTYILKAAQLKQKVAARYKELCAHHQLAVEDLGKASQWNPATDLQGLIGQGVGVGIQQRAMGLSEDVVGLQEMLIYGLKGTAAYAHHAKVQGAQESPLVNEFFNEALWAIAQSNSDVNELVRLNMKCGEINLMVMEMLDLTHTNAFGHPVPTPVRVEAKKGKAILISGHDLHDLEALLKQTESKGINVYTHSEMLPAHGYPGLKKYSHLAGNYGGAWHTQQKEFEDFPGPIVMTSNCIQKPKDSYKDRIFTCGPVAWPGLQHIDNLDFSRVIECAQESAGFSEEGGDKTILTGFAHNAVLSVAPQVIDAVKQGAIKHFFLVGGCDGHKQGREYYKEFTQALPEDTIILTLGCAKFRFNNEEFGTIGGIPRLLDMGQCNDAYSAIKVASALADAFGTDVNGLPLTLNISWYEQKAVCILLTLLHLGIKKIRLGPTLPAFVKPSVLKLLVENFEIGTISTPQKDLAQMLAKA